MQVACLSHLFKDFSNVVYRQSIRPGNRVSDPLVHDIVALKYKRDGQVVYKPN